MATRYSLLLLLVAACGGANSNADAGTDGAGGPGLARAAYCAAMAEARCAVFAGCCTRYAVAADCLAEQETYCESRAAQNEANGRRYNGPAALECVARWSGFAAPGGACTVADPRSAAYLAFIETCSHVWSEGTAAPGESCGPDVGANCAPQDGGEVVCYTRGTADAGVSECEFQAFIPEGMPCPSYGPCAPGTHCDVDLVCAANRTVGAACDPARRFDCGPPFLCVGAICVLAPLELVCEEADDDLPP